MYSADENSTGLMGSRRVRKRACATSGSVACYAESADGAQARSSDEAVSIDQLVTQL
jgi:hypothetical protein